MTFLDIMKKFQKVRETWLSKETEIIARKKRNVRPKKNRNDRDLMERLKRLKKEENKKKRRLWRKLYSRHRARGLSCLDPTLDGDHHPPGFGTGEDLLHSAHTHPLEDPLHPGRTLCLHPSGDHHLHTVVPSPHLEWEGHHRPGPGDQLGRLVRISEHQHQLYCSGTTYHTASHWFPCVFSS